MPQPQNFQNHARFDPLFHFFLMPVFFLNIPASILWYAHHRHAHLHSGLWVIFLSVALFFLVMKTRLYALKLQDRIIRLEERTRLTALLSAEQLQQVASLTIQQLIALRFSPDGELPALALRAAAEGLDPKQIKQSIHAWRSDDIRV